ncbi:cyclin-dependent kinase 2-interacting protein isoform X2 [Anguilla anguilla]|uniref:cyclin-dependent kinase 2-interacting protein isoform X2 n=1 Tax=Anguilla anguilla TaxID=7936 RepID=UPI0015A9C3D0|nr:cyclin-dependent kinase 2-interacting protein isoform X2 [Anguilla anguilla]
MEAKSPGASTPCRKPVMSGSARKLKDNAADWHNFVMKWDRLNDEGSTIANQIVNLKLSKEAVKEADIAEDGGQTAITQRTGSASAAAAELEDRCSALVVILEKMAHLVSKMEKLASSTKGVCELQEFQQERTDEVSSRLLRSYREELALKEVIVGEIAHTCRSDLALVYLSCWLYQPYLEQSSTVQLESLLLETGHRPL